MKLPSKETVERLRDQYLIGTRVELVSMDDPHSKLVPGDRGHVLGVDDTGTVFVDWDKGSKLGLVYGVDQFKQVGDLPTLLTATEYFQEVSAVHGIEGAIDIGGRYLDSNMGADLIDVEKLFCRELFTVMFEAGSQKTAPDKLVYPYDFNTADDRTEGSFYHQSRKRNEQCAKAIDKAINGSCYKANYYNLDLAAMKAVHEYGFARVNAVLAHTIQQQDYDGRYSTSNKQWAKAFAVPEKAFGRATLNTHPTLIDSFVGQVRKFYDYVDAERFVLPGRPESGEAVQGYEIVRAIEFDNQRGFAIGLNPHAPAEFVCWQFTTEDGARDYYWGRYFGTLTDAAESFVARVIVHMDGGDVKEVQRETAAPELNEAEQNFAAWMAVTESSRYRWVEDEIYRLNGRGAMYYTGGEDGVYMRINKDGKLEAGNYEGAIPHIGEAFFKPAVTKNYDSFSDAYKAAMEAGGKQFMVDMFSGQPEERQSVRKLLREAQKAPKPPTKPKNKTRGDGAR